MNKKLLGALVIALVLLFGCKDKENDITEPVPGNDVDSVIDLEPKYVAPLTGEKMEEEVTQRPIAVTINNHPLARPQAGISSADIVYELLVEGDATRFLAIYQSQLPEQVGPIRSARDYLIELAKGLDSFYLAHGYSPSALELLNSGTIDHANGMRYDGIYFKRSSNRKAPHNSYISAENIKAVAEKVGINLTLHKKSELTFYDSIENVKIGNSASKIQMNYFNSNSSSNSTYTYEEKSQTYLKAYGTQAMLDELTNSQVAVSNVLFFEAPHRVADSEGRRVITLSEGGNAYVFQAGVMREVAWKNKNGVLVAVEEDGSEVKLIPGKTWVHLVPTSPGLTKSVLYSE